MNGPSLNEQRRIEGVPQVCFIRNTVSNPDIVIGDKLVIGGSARSRPSFPKIRRRSRLWNRPRISP
ncbi:MULTISPECIES: hypothetical protein [unclassified Caballeronia]|uniref:hypothetical protein n=1 Tax=unclassified Caballeronia TaxID=2646786 RepID=UPI0028658AE2|nr:MULTISPECIES: hypothetical protein [unclassified Caballeronia]MDR5750723.1 hypothetical protein [Caballeronia sp. LZ024]MDR5842245.1 hypothetical protein [Caballeronia sp. LZ031]